jgi:hypothetical protein
MSLRKTPSQKTEESVAERLSEHAIKWIGSLNSLALHTVVFCLTFSLYFLGVSFSVILLVVTTVVSLEAIYLAIFVQMTLNRHSKQLKTIEDDEDEDLDIMKEETADLAMLERIEHSLKELGKEVAELKQKKV